MEELFKSLSESVSEECFEDIMGIVEELIQETIEQEIIKNHGKPEFEKDENGKIRYKDGSPVPANKSAKLLRKISSIKHDDSENFRYNPSNRSGGAAQSYGKVMQYLPKNIGRHGWGAFGLYEQPGKRQTKNHAGQTETYYHRYKTNNPEKSGTSDPTTGYPYYYGDGHHADAINTNEKKQKKSDQQAIKASKTAFGKHLKKKLENKSK